MNKRERDEDAYDEVALISSAKNPRNDRNIDYNALVGVNPEKIGWPSELPQLQKVKHGWFRPGNQEMLIRLLKQSSFIPSEEKFVHSSDQIHRIVELGSWLGTSTEFLLQQSPHATIIAVDLWENEYFYGDSHYNKSDTQFAQILSNHSIYDQFLNNLIDYKYQEHSDTNRLIPMKLHSVEALEILAAQKIVPDLIYIDASHHYDFVVEDITACVKLFPTAILVGDDWDNPDVRQAVKDMARKFQKEIYIRGGTCWSFAKEVMKQIEEIEMRKMEQEQQQKKRLKGSFADALQLLKEQAATKKAQK